MKKVKRVRVINGDNFYGDNEVQSVETLRAYYTQRAIDELITCGKWEYVEEEKSLEEKFIEWYKNDFDCPEQFEKEIEEYSLALIKIAHDHFKERFDKAVKDEPTARMIAFDTSLQFIRQALFGKDGEQ